MSIKKKSLKIIIVREDLKGVNAAAQAARLVKLFFDYYLSNWMMFQLKGVYDIERDNDDE